MPQTAYTVNQAAAFAGQIYDLGENDFISAVNQSADTPYGVAMVQGAGGDNRAAFPASSGDLAKFLGVVSASQSNEQQFLGVGQTVYKAGKDLPLLRKGRIWVLVEENVAAQDPVFVRYAAGAGGTQLGAFRKSADTATAAQLSRAVYRTTALAGSFAVVEVNWPA